MAKGTALQAKAEATVDSLRRLGRLAERLLALARAEGNVPLTDEWVDLAQVAALTAGEFRHNVRLHGRRLLVETSRARIRGDLDAVGLAVRNLVENALVHGAGGTTIRIACSQSARAATIAVIDDGPGVAAGELPSLVKRFARGANAQGGGAGLGLPIVDTLARRMGAKLVLRSPAEGQSRGLEARLVWEVAP
jgi:two-component system, OmpR family, sensor kinase